MLGIPEWNTPRHWLALYQSGIPQGIEWQCARVEYSPPHPQTSNCTIPEQDTPSPRHWMALYQSGIPLPQLSIKQCYTRVGHPSPIMTLNCTIPDWDAPHALNGTIPEWDTSHALNDTKPERDTFSPPRHWTAINQSGIPPRHYNLSFTVLLRKPFIFPIKF